VLNTEDNEFVMQLDTVLRTTTNLYIDDDDDLAVTLSEFFATAGNGNDTLFWRTESEHEHLGFYLKRRVVPGFIDSLAKVVDSTRSDTALDYAGTLYKQGRITRADTLWALVLPKMIKGAEGGTSVGPRDYMVIDYRVHNDVVYEYVLEAVDFGMGKKSYGPVKVMPTWIRPKAFKLWASYPNPFRHYTNIKFDLPIRTKVSLNVYNLQGRLVTRLIKPEMPMEPGWYKVRWNGLTEYGAAVASGPYIYRLVASKYAKAKVMIKLK
jgi:hypothetical protein